MEQLQQLDAKIKGRHPKARTEIDGDTLYVEIGQYQCHIRWEDGQYNFQSEAVGYQEATSGMFTNTDDLLEMILVR